MKTVTKDICTGNQSGKEGDLSPKYKLVQQINDEVDEMEEGKENTKAAEKEDKEKLVKNEAIVLNGKKRKANSNTAVRIKGADGVITIDGEREAKREARTNNSFESKLLKLMEMEVNSRVNPFHAAEAVQKGLVSYMKANMYTLERFLNEVYAVTGNSWPNYLLGALSDIGGLEILIYMYCTPEDLFSAAKFTAMLVEMEIKPRDARLVHLGLNKW